MSDPDHAHQGDTVNRMSQREFRRSLDVAGANPPNSRSGREQRRARGLDRVCRGPGAAGGAAPCHDQQQPAAGPFLRIEFEARRQNISSRKCWRGARRTRPAG